MDVRMPDGSVVRNVPEGTTKAQVMARYQQTQGRQQGTSIPSDLSVALSSLTKGFAAIPDSIINTPVNGGNLLTAMVGAPMVGVGSLLQDSGMTDANEGLNLAHRLGLTNTMEPPSPITNAIRKHVGLTDPATTGQHIADWALQGAAGAVLAPSTALGQAIRNTALGAGAGAAGGVTAEVTGDPVKGLMMATLAAPAAVAAGQSVKAGFPQLMTQAGRERSVGNFLQKNIKNPQAAIEQLREAPIKPVIPSPDVVAGQPLSAEARPASLPTSAQVLAQNGDTTLIGVEKSLGEAPSIERDIINSRYDSNAAAREAQMERLVPMPKDAGTQSIQEMVRAEVERQAGIRNGLGQQAEMAAADARSNAGRPITDQAAGERMGIAYDQAYRQQRKDTSQAFDAVDPSKQVSGLPVNVKELSATIDQYYAGLQKSTPPEVRKALGQIDEAINAGSSKPAPASQEGAPPVGQPKTPSEITVDNKPVKVVETVPDDFLGLPENLGDPKAMREFVKKSLLGKKVVNEGTNTEIGFYGQGLQSSLKNKNTDARRLYPVLPRLLEKAEFMGYEPNVKLDQKPHIAGYEKYLSAVNIDGKVHPVRIKVEVVKGDLRGKGYYYHQVESVEVGGGVGYSRELHGRDPNSPAPLTPLPDQVDVNIAQPPKPANNLLDENLSQVLQQESPTLTYAQMRTLESSIGEAANKAHVAGDAQTAAVLNKFKHTIRQSMQDGIDSGVVPPETGAAYKNAMQTRRQQGETFEDGAVGQLRKERNGERAVKDENIPKAMLQGGKAAHDSFQRAIGKDPAVAETAQDWLATRWREAVQNPADGALRSNWRTSSAKFLSEHADVLKAYPDLQKKLDLAVRRSASAEDLAARFDAEMGALSKETGARFFLKSVDPANALDSFLKSKNRMQDGRFILQLAKRDPDFRQSMNGAIRDHIMDMKNDQQRVAFIEDPQNQRLVSGLFGDKMLQQWQKVAADAKRDLLRQTKNISRGSDTASKEQGLELAGRVASKTMWADLFRRVNDAIGGKRRDQLRGEAMVDPAKAADLLDKRVNAPTIRDNLKKAAKVTTPQALQLENKKRRKTRRGWLSISANKKSPG